MNPLPVEATKDADKKASSERITFKMKIMKKMSRKFTLLLMCMSLAIVAEANEVTPQTMFEMAKKEQSAFLDTVQTLVNIDSGTGNKDGLNKIEGILTQRLTELEANVMLEPPRSGVGNIVLGYLQGKGKAKFLLMIHYDTVFAEGEAQRRPFRSEQGRIFGPGVADAKGSLALILHSLKLLNEMNYDDYGTITVLFNADEEKGSFGSRDLIQETAAGHDYVLSYEPPDTDAVSVATSGINYLFLDVTGVASHAGSAPDLGRNAIIELSHQLLQLNDLGNPDKKTTVNWTLVKGGEKRNIIPDRASAEGDMRFSDYSEIERVTNDAQKIIQNQLIPGTQVSFHLQRGRPPLPSNPISKQLAVTAQKVYKDIGLDLDITKMHFGTDAGYAYQEGAEKPAVLETLGLVGNGLHSPKEYALLNSIAPRLYLTIALIMELSKHSK
jgi:glutamate carboxypeptidase